MSLGLLSLTSSSASRVRTSLILFALAVLSTPAHGQGDWRLLDFGLETGFASAYEWPTAGSTFAFIDSLRGYYFPESELTPGSRTYYVTTDAGRTWSTTPNFVPTPQRMVDATFGISSSGWLTSNGGTSWQQIRPVLDQTFAYEGVDAIAGSTKHVAALSQPVEADSATGQIRPIGPNRLTLSTDGGVTWTSLDSMVVETIAGTNERKLELYDSTGFGDLPAPANMTDTFSVGWLQLYDMPDTNTAIVGALAFGRVNGQLQNHYYIGRLNLLQMTAAWTKLPFIGVVPTTTIMPSYVQFVTPQIGWAIQSITETIQGSPVPRFVFWRTVNGGQDWTQNAVPIWVDFGSLRFVNPRLGIALNAITTDGGVTWKQWAHPFEGGSFYASDSTHYFVANRFSLFARSTDAGRSWRRNESGAVPRALVGYDSVLVVGRSYRSILSSTDRGETWRDADLEGSVPPTMTTVWAMAIPDSVHVPKRVLGVATFISYDADTSLGVIESTDGGLTWIKKLDLAGIKSPSGSVLIDFTENAETQNTGYIATGRRLYASIDDGATWSLRDTTLFYQAIEAVDGSNIVQVNASGINTSTTSGTGWTRTQALPAARNRALGLRSFDPINVRSLFPDRQRRNVDWNLGVSTDGGNTWTMTEHAGAPLPLDGFLFWRDADTAYAVGRGATVQRSLDGGKSFTMLKDSSNEFRPLGGWIVSGIDDVNLYVAGAGDAIGLWALVAPPAAAPDDAATRLPVQMSGNVTGDRATLELALESPSRVTIDLVDVIGKTAFAESSDLAAGRHRIGLNVDELPVGMYMVRVSDGKRTTVLPLRVMR